MNKKFFINKDLLYKIYLDIFLKSDYVFYEYNEISSSYKNSIVYETNTNEYNGIRYKFILSFDPLFFYFSKGSVEIKSHGGDTIFISFKRKDIKKHTKYLFNKLIINQEDMTKKFIPNDYLRKEKILNIKKCIN